MKRIACAVLLVCLLSCGGATESLVGASPPTHDAIPSLPMPERPFATNPPAAHTFKGCDAGYTFDGRSCSKWVDVALSCSMSTLAVFDGTELARNECRTKNSSFLRWSFAGQRRTVSVEFDRRTIFLLKDGKDERPFAQIGVVGLEPWKPDAEATRVRITESAVRLFDGRIFVIGTTALRSYIHVAEIYDPDQRTWTAVENLPRTVDQPTAFTLGDGRVLVVGNDGGTLFDPATNQWRQVTELSYGFGYPAIGLLPDGRALVVGGTAYSHANRAFIWDPATNATYRSADTQGWYYDSELIVSSVDRPIVVPRTIPVDSGQSLVEEYASVQ